MKPQIYSATVPLADADIERLESADPVQTQSRALTRIKAVEALADAQGVVVAVELGEEANDVIEATLTLSDRHGRRLRQEYPLLLRIHAPDMTLDATAYTISDGGTGTLLTGDDAASMRFQTDADGVAVVNLTDVAGQTDATAILSATPLGGTEQFFDVVFDDA